jgi:hypothetical protein
MTKFEASGPTLILGAHGFVTDVLLLELGSLLEVHELQIHKPYIGDNSTSRPTR